MRIYIFLAILLGGLSSCTQPINDEEVQKLRASEDVETLKEYEKTLTDMDQKNWQQLHNLGYISYLLWELGEGDVVGLRQSLEYFQDSYNLGEDERTRHNIEILEALLEKLKEAMQAEVEEQSEEAETGDTEDTSTGEEEGDRSEEGGTSEESGNSASESETENGENSGNTQEIQAQSEPLFREFGFNSEQELLDELERYTEELLERQANNIWQLHRNQDDLNGSIEDFFFGRKPFFHDMREQGEKDW